MVYERKTYMRREEAAARVLRVLKDRAPETLTLDQLARQTNLDISQVRNGERFLKQVAYEHPEEMGGFTLHIALGPESQHGLIQDGDLSHRDALARAAYMANRTVSELNYREQQIASVEDPVAKKKLRRGIVMMRAGQECFADAYEKMDGQRVLEVTR